MSGFSAVTWRAAHAPWTFTTARRRTYEARPLSGPRVLQFLVETEGARPAAREAALEALLREAFPLRWSFVWRGDPVREILRAPLAEREAILTSFFRFQGVSRLTPPPRRTRSVGSSSS